MPAGHLAIMAHESLTNVVTIMHESKCNLSLSPSIYGKVCQELAYGLEFSPGWLCLVFAHHNSGHC